MLLKNQPDWIKIMDVTLFSIFESVSFLLIQTLLMVQQMNKPAIVEFQSEVGEIQ